VATAIVTFYPLIRDRVLRTKDYDCKFLPDKNPEFVIAMAFVGHHVPCVVIVVCYAIVYYEIRRLVKNRPQDRHKNSPPSRRKVATSKVTPSAYVVDDNKTIAGIGEENGTEKGLTTAETSLNGKEHTKTAGTKDVKPGVAEEDIVVENNHGKKSQAQGTSKVQPGDHEAQAANEKQKADHKAVNKRRKTFITLSYIVLAYMVCWVPFHFVFDVSLANPTIVPEDLYTAAFWMTYVNSGLNPFMYAFSSVDFRKAVIQMIKCHYCRSQM